MSFYGIFQGFIEIFYISLDLMSFLGFDFMIFFYILDAVELLSVF